MSHGGHAPDNGRRDLAVREPRTVGAGVLLLRGPADHGEIPAEDQIQLAGRAGNEGKPYPPAMILTAALAEVGKVDAGAIARSATDRRRIPDLVHAARVAAVKALRRR